MNAKRMGSPAEGESSRSAPHQPVAGYVVLCVGLGFAYHAWPGGLGDVPLASVTLAMISQAVYAVCLALMALLIAGKLRD